MGRFFIIALAAIGTVYKIDPSMRPYIDAGFLLLLGCFMFWLGDLLRVWLDRLEAKPHRKKAQAPRRQRPTRPRYSGASTPLLTR